jgi:hypothetical protein
MEMLNDLQVLDLSRFRTATAASVFAGNALAGRRRGIPHSDTVDRAVEPAHAAGANPLKTTAMTKPAINPTANANFYASSPMDTEVSILVFDTEGAVAAHAQFRTPHRAAQSD